jgi:hypothetical protein
VALSTNTNTIPSPLRAHQGGEAVIYIGDATLCFGRSLVIADGGLARQVAHHRLYDRTQRQRSARIPALLKWRTLATPGVTDLSYGTSSGNGPPRRMQSAGRGLSAA